ncbi:MAG: efflux RND transporter periplasmic adaptor subunit [Luteolibacter sp.]
MMEVTLRTIEQRVDLVGSIAANESVEIRSEIPGIIESIHFEEGDSVKKGQRLLKLDTRELEAQLRETRASHMLASRNLERNRTLLRDGAVSQLEVDTASAEHERLLAAIELLEVRIDKSSITAPFAGIVGARAHSVGDYVDTQKPITTIEDLSRLKIEIQVPERYLSQLHPGASFSIQTTAAGAEEAVTGQVYFISSRIDETSRAALIKGYLSDPPAALKPGMFANVSLVLQAIKDAMVVPETAILNTPRGSVIITPQERDGATVAAFTPVKTGIRIPGYVQISPLGPPVRPGDPVVSAGVGGLILFPGVKIKAVDPVVKPGLPEETDRRLEKAAKDTED